MRQVFERETPGMTPDGALPKGERRHQMGVPRSDHRTHCTKPSESAKLARERHVGKKPWLTKPSVPARGKAGAVLFAHAR